MAVSTQTIDQIEQLINLQDMAANQASQQDQSNQESEKRESKQPKQINDSEEDRIDQDRDFGYLGRNDFLVAPKAKQLLQPLKYFGYDYFINQAQSFSAISDIAIPPDYVLGPGDEVKIIFYGNNNKKYTLQVTRDGDIFIPEVGPVSVAGLTFSDMKETIQQIVNNQLIGTQFSLTLGELRSINIFVLGEAKQPGMYTVGALSTLTNAIFLSGGINNTGSLRNIQLKRNGVTLSKFDFYELLLNGDTSNDRRLMSGDVVFIPPIGKTVGISGEVERPGIYELIDKENAQDLVSYAGKIKAKANLRSIELQRIDELGNGFNLINIDLKQMPFENLMLNDGDRLSIGSVIEKINNAILLKGHAPSPGYYPWSQGLTIRDIISSKEDLLPNTDMNYLLIQRQKQSNQTIEVLQVNINDIFKNNNDVLLEQKDQIIFFPSKLTTNLIKTEVIDDNEQLGLIYLRKSQEEQKKMGSMEIVQPMSDSFENKDRSQNMQNSLNDNQDYNIQNENFYIYSVYDYCVLSDDIIESLLSEDNSDDKLFNEESLNKSYQLTRFCRKQLIEPILYALQQEGSQIQAEQIVEVYGNVYFPGKYPLSFSSNVQDLIYASGGLKSNTYLEDVEISSKSIEGKEVSDQYRSIQYRDSLTEPLKPLDIVTIKQMSDRINTVELLGEVYFPGVYPISKNETLLQLVARAGGLTDKANMKNTYFTRKEIAERELKIFQQAQEDWEEVGQR